MFRGKDRVLGGDVLAQDSVKFFSFDFLLAH